MDSLGGTDGKVRVGIQLFQHLTLRDPRTKPGDHSGEGGWAAGWLGLAGRGRGDVRCEGGIGAKVVSWESLEEIRVEGRT